MATHSEDSGSVDASGSASSGGMAGAAARGQPALARWLHDGLLVSGVDFAVEWCVSVQALEQAVERRELFNITVGGATYYLEPLAHLYRSDVARVCLALGRADGGEMLVFWLRQHGGLGGQTAIDALGAGKVARVVDLAEGQAEENGLS